jgi:ribonuclease T2
MDPQIRFLGRLRAAALLALGLALVGALSSAQARHRSFSASGTPGEFAYYLLSLSWSPAYCLDSPRAAECNGPRRYGFIVHGLWPQYESGAPEYCDAHSPLPDAVVEGMVDLMPARGLIHHEWSAHGSCSGLAAIDFFALLRRADEGVRIPAEFSGRGAATEQSLLAIAAAFRRANPQLPEQGFVITCTRQSEPRLREVRLCLGRNLAPRTCAADVLREGCRAASLIVPPIR